MTVQPHQVPRCAADSSANCVSPGSGMHSQPLAPAGAAPGSICFLLVVHQHRGCVEGPPSIPGGEGPPVAQATTWTRAEGSGWGPAKGQYP